MRNIDIGFLRTFLATIDLDGLTRAAEAVHKSQSTVSAQLRKVEQTVGAPLFEKHGRKMKLTEQGERLSRHARRIISLHDQALWDLSAGPRAGKIRLAVMDDYAVQVLPDFLSQFTDRYPDIDIDVSCGFSQELLKELGTSFDLVVSTHPVGTGRGERLGIERTHWVFAQGKDVPANKPLPLAVLPSGNLFRSWGIRALEDNRIPFRIAFTGSGVASVEAAAAAGIAVAIAKGTSALPGLRSVGRELGLPPLPDTEIMLNAVDHAKSDASRLLADFLIEHMG